MKNFSIPVALALAAITAAPATAGSLTGGYREAYEFYYFRIHSSVRIDAQVADGVPAGTMTMRISTHDLYDNRVTHSRYEFAILSLDIAGNEAWIVAWNQDYGYWSAHIADIGNRGDLVNGVGIHGDFDVVE